MASTQVQTGVVKYARSLGWRAHKWVRPGRKGATDFFFTKYKQQIVFMEFKDFDETPEPLQLLEHKRLRLEGHEIHVIGTIEEGRAIFTQKQ